MPACPGLGTYKPAGFSQGYPKTLSDKRDTHESCSRSIWKYSCLSRTNQRHYKVIVLDLAQNELKKTSPNISMLKWEGERGIVESSFSRRAKQRGFKCSPGRDEVFKNCHERNTTRLHFRASLQIKGVSSWKQSLFSSTDEYLEKCNSVRALDNGELSKEKQLFLKQLLASAAAENAKKLNMLHGCSTSSVLLSWATFLH